MVVKCTALRFGVTVHEIARSVEPPESGVRDKLLRRQLRPLVVAACQPHAAQTQLPRDAICHLVKITIKDIGLQAGHGRSNGNGLPHANLAAQGRDRALRGAVAIDQPPPECPAIRNIAR